MKGFTFCILLSLLMLSKIALAQFKVVGYAHPFKSIETSINKIAFSKLTHLNIAFVNPDSTRELLIPFGFDTLITRST